MTIQSEVRPESRFPTVFLPWLIAAGALAVYLGTINRWVSFDSLTQVAKLSGWSWQPELHGPAYWLVTYPLRWLPLKTIPLALNIFSAVCAALSLALLARSVALLPHDRTLQEREKEHSESACLSIPTAWLPPLLAAVVCGLQLTFWERATAGSNQFFTHGSNEMFDLLLFAYVIRCLLEFRVGRGESWLIRAAFVYGIGMTNNWAMIGFFPLFLAALVWLKGLSFFSRQFLVGAGLSLLAGLSLYLLLPLVQSLSDSASMPFWPSLKVSLNSQRTILKLLYQNRGQLWILCLFSIVPVLFTSVRWASYFGDSSPLGIALARFMFYVVHALFLVVCIWVALDPPVSPRNKGLGVPFLTFYYLGALCVGYFSGYFLLVFRGTPKGSRRPPAYVRVSNAAVNVGIWVLLVLATAGLVYKNLPQIQITNGPMLRQYAALLAQQLPPHGAVVMSDDARRSLLLQAWAAQKGKAKDYLFVDTAAKSPGGAPGPLTFPEYHRFLKRNYPQWWPVLVPKGYSQPVDQGFLVQLALRLAATNSVYYLHPSFGYYFEWFYPEPHGLVYKLRPYPADTLTIPPPAKDLMDENNRFWDAADKSALKPLVAAIEPTIPGKEPRLIDLIVAKLRLAKEQNHDARVVAGFYSRALDYWGVDLQKLGRLTNAAALFSRALELNPDNIVAQINLKCNKNLQAGQEMTVQESRAVEDEFGRARTWDAVINENGPFDEPSFSFKQGRLLALNNLQHQAAEQFERVKTLVPTDLSTRLWLAQLYVVNRLPSKAMQLVDEIRAHPAVFPVPNTNRTEMLFVETSAHLANGDLKGAETAVATALRRYPDDVDVLDTAAQVFINFKCYSNALGLLEQQIKLSPTNITALVGMGNVCIYLGKYEQAIAPLTNALLVDSNNPYAILDLAIANLRCGNLDAAQKGYETLQKSFPTSTRISYGLQEVAYRKKDTNAAIRYCQLYLASAGGGTNSDEAKIVRERLKQLKTGAR
jgi:tetratricopeptide (TPR) repeat protein